MQYIQVHTMYKWISVSYFIVLILLCWMIYQKFPPFIRFEKKATQFFKHHFGQPQMGYSDGVLNSVLTFLATYGSAPYISLLTTFIGGFLFLKGEWGLAIWLLGVVSSGGIFGIFLKKLFRRERPDEHLAFDTGYSFPSGHAIASTLFFLAMLLVFLPAIPSVMIRTLLMGLVYLVWAGILFSRMYFHAHHLGDLLAGISLGVFWVLTSMSVYNRILGLLLKAFKEIAPF